VSKEIFIDTSKIDKLTKELQGFKPQIAEAAYFAVNRVLDQMVTQAGRIVPKNYAIKGTEVKKSFNGGIKRPTKQDLSGSITTKGHTLSLAHFPHSPTAPSGKKYKVRVSIRKGGRKVLKTHPSPFIMTTGAKSSDRTQFNVFKREGKARFPVKVIRTLSIPQMIQNTKVTEELQEFAIQKLDERLQHEIERSMLKLSGRIK
jgi:hypothetical protein